MFANELLKDKLSLNQQSGNLSDNQQNENIQEKDFTFNQYIPQVEDSIMGSQVKQQGGDRKQRQENQQLIMLKQHISTIETIAMKEIEELKMQLEQERRQKQHLKNQFGKNQQIHSIQPSETDRNSSDLVELLKEQNKMLKEALKKQLQINKNLIKASIMSDSVTESDKNKQNCSHNANLSEENQKHTIKSSLIALIDRPSIPLPSSHTKKPLLRA